MTEPDAERHQRVGLSLTGSDASFDLSVDGYQYPGATGWDGEWLFIDVRARSAGRRWSFRSPCLLADEIVSLIAWLNAIGRGRDGILDTRLEFMEPELAFTFARAEGSTIRLAVEFRFGAVPPWSASEGAGDEGAFGISFEVTSDQLRDAAAALAASVPAIIDTHSRIGHHIE